MIYSVFTIFFYCCRVMAIEIFNLKLERNEIYYIEINKEKFGTSKQLNATSHTNKNSGFNSSLHNITGIITTLKYMPQSDLNKDCYFDDSLKYFDKYSKGANDGGIISRHIQSLLGEIYITTTYDNITDKDNKQVNRLETVRLRFSSSSKPQMDQIESRDIKYEVSDTSRLFTTKCLQTHYVLHLKTAICLCIERFELKYYKLVFYVVNKYLKIVLDQFRVEDLRRDYDKIQMKMQYMQDGRHEIVIHWMYGDFLWIFYVDQVSISNFKKVMLNIKLYSFHYASRDLNIMETDCEDNYLNSCKTYYLIRFPGDKLQPDKITLLEKMKYIQTYASNEDSEIIIETARLTSHFGKMYTVAQNIFSINTFTNKVNLIRNVVLSLPAEKHQVGYVIDIETINLRDQSIALLQVEIEDRYPDNLPKVKSIKHQTFMIVIDPVSSLESEVIPSQSYELYRYKSCKSNYNEEYYYIPKKELNLSLPNNQNQMKKCAVLKQNFNRNRLKITNPHKSPSFFPYLNLTFNESMRQINVFQLNIEFIENSDEPKNKYELWLANNRSNYWIVAKGKSSIPVEQIIRGSFFIKDCDEFRTRIDYSTETWERIDNLDGCSLTSISSSKLEDIKSLEIEDHIVELFGVEKVISEYKSTTHVFLRYGYNEATTIYEKEGKVMRKIREYILTSKVKKVIPLNSNFYFFFFSDGTFSGYNSSNGELTAFSYPGVGCKDINLNYESFLSSSIVCLNENNEFSAYYIHELRIKSIMNSYIKVESSGAEFIDSNCRLMSSESYPKKIFIIPKASSRQPNLYLFHMEILGKFQLSKVKEYLIEVPHESIHKLKSDYKTKIMIQAERIIVHHRFSESENTFSFYELDEYFELKKLKVADLSSHYTIDEDAEMYEYKKDYASTFVSDKTPLLVIKVRTRVNLNEQNVLIIDPFSPALETFPTLVLVRNSVSPKMSLFPTYGFNFKKVKVTSFGIIHYMTVTPGLLLPSIQNNYLFQFVSVEELRVIIKNSFRTNPHKLLFESKKEQLEKEMELVFKSHPYLNEEESRYHIKKRMNITQADSIHEPESESLIINNLTFNSSASFNQKKEFSWTEMLKIPFSEIYNLTCADIQYKENSIFREIGDLIKITKPIQVVGENFLGEISQLNEYDRFCSKYSKRTGVEPPKCTKYGIVLLMTSKVGVMYSESLMEVQEKDIIFVDFDTEKCTEHFVIHHMLLSFCLDQNEKKVASINLMTLEIKYMKYKYPITEPMKSKPTKYRLDELYFIDLSLYSKNYANIMTKMNEGITFYSSLPIPEKIDALSSLNNLNALYDTIGNKADSTLLLYKYISGDKFGFSRLNLIVHNLEYLSINFYGSRSLNRNVELEDEKDPITIGIFKFNGTTEVANTILTNGHIIGLIFDSKEQTIINETSIYSNVLIYLPSYHSYYFRLFSDKSICSTSIYVFHNPFAGIVNQNNAVEPACRLWACVFLSSYGSESYITLYHIDYEKIRTRPANFKQIFEGKEGVPRDMCSKLQGETILNIDTVPNSLKMYPIQILKLDDVKAIHFDKSQAKITSSEQLYLFAFKTSGEVVKIVIEKYMRVETFNPYLSSTKIDMEVVRLHSKRQTLTINILSTKESNYYKYWVFIALLVTGGAVYSVISYFKIMRMQLERETGKKKSKLAETVDDSEKEKLELQE